MKLKIFYIFWTSFEEMFGEGDIFSPQIQYSRNRPKHVEHLDLSKTGSRWA